MSGLQKPTIGAGTAVDPAGPGSVLIDPSEITQPGYVPPGAPAGYTMQADGLGSAAWLSNTPALHAASHQHGGSDEVAVAAGAANAIPKANGTGRLDPSWIPAKEIIQQAEPNANLGSLRVRSIGGTGGHRLNFHVPPDFGTLVSAALVAITKSAGAVGAGRDIDLTAEYGQRVGEAYNNHTVADTTSTYVVPAENQGWEIDLSTLLAGINAGDSGGLFIDHNGIGGSIAYRGIRIRYLPA